MPARPFFALTVNWCIAALLCGATYLVCYSVPLADLAADPSLARFHTIARSLAMLLLTLSTVSAALAVMGIIACLRDPAVPGPYVAWVGFACAMPFLVYVAINLMTWPMHRHALERTAQRGAAVVALIERYTAEHGAPPERIPDSPTSLAGYPTFSYTRFSPKDARRTLWWYDLGPRQGRTGTATWSYPDGDIGHAILAVELDGEERVASAEGDRTSLDIHASPFDPARWREKTPARQAMVAAISRSIEHRSAAEVRALLGPPDGERVLVDTPWELWVRTWPSDLDRFFYWPTRRYPVALGKCSVTAVGDWAYARN
jgi:hypothetical protein